MIIWHGKIELHLLYYLIKKNKISWSLLNENKVSCSLLLDCLKKDIRTLISDYFDSRFELHFTYIWGFPPLYIYQMDMLDYPLNSMIHVCATKLLRTQGATNSRFEQKLKFFISLWLDRASKTALKNVFLLILKSIFRRKGKIVFVFCSPNISQLLFSHTVYKTVYRYSTKLSFYRQFCTLYEKIVAGKC